MQLDNIAIFAIVGLCALGSSTPTGSDRTLNVLTPRGVPRLQLPYPSKNILYGGDQRLRELAANGQVLLQHLKDFSANGIEASKDFVQTFSDPFKYLNRYQEAKVQDEVWPIFDERLPFTHRGTQYKILRLHSKHTKAKPYKQQYTILLSKDGETAILPWAYSKWDRLFDAENGKSYEKGENIPSTGEQSMPLEDTLAWSLARMHSELTITAKAPSKQGVRTAVATAVGGVNRFVIRWSTREPATGAIEWILKKHRHEVGSWVELLPGTTEFEAVLGTNLGALAPKLLAVTAGSGKGARHIVSIHLLDEKADEHNLGPSIIIKLSPSM